MGGLVRWLSAAKMAQWLRGFNVVLCMAVNTHSQLNTPPQMRCLLHPSFRGSEPLQETGGKIVSVRGGGN